MKLIEVCHILYLLNFLIFYKLIYNLFLQVLMIIQIIPKFTMVKNNIFIYHYQYKFLH
jgi:hypothetical protein